MNTNRLKEMAAELRAMFPGKVSVEIHTQDAGYSLLRIFGCGDYAAATELARTLGLHVRNKQVHDPANPWFVLSGSNDGLDVSLFGSGLPSSCAVVKVTEKIPKVNTVDTGEFIEVERQQIVCGQEGQEAKA